MMKKGLFFDLDGTLWDAILPIQESWNKTMESKREPYRFDYASIRSMMGLTPLETLPIAFPGKEEKEAMALFQACVKDEIVYLSKHPGTLYSQEEEVLKSLASRYPLYIVSNSDKGYVENYLTSCHMEKYFTGHLCAGDTKMDKHDNIRLLKEKEKLDQVIYIGDTAKDRTETEKAKCLFIHAAYGFGKIENDTCFIPTIAELPSKVEEVFQKT